MISLGVWSCQYRELRPINFGGSSSTTAAGSSATEAGGSAEGEITHGDEEQGYGRNGVRKAMFE